MKNVEVKARCTPSRHDAIRQLLASRKATSAGTDHQIDTYFNVPNGRLKLREGNIENCLIQYARDDVSGPKVSKYTLSYFKPDTPIKAALTAALGVLVVVDKKREIYYLGNVKIHLDTINEYGTFVEIEARDERDEVPLEDLELQTKELIRDFCLNDESMISGSYSDMILKGK